MICRLYLYQTPLDNPPISIPLRFFKDLTPLYIQQNDKKPAHEIRVTGFFNFLIK